MKGLVLVLVVLVFGYVVKGCVPCVPGTANDGTAMECGSCAAGTCLQNTSCPTCPTGEYSSNSHQSQCKGCQAGWQPSITQTRCLPCPAGTANDVSGGLCESCQVGTYAFSIGNTECKQCPEGKYADTTGLSACKPCGDGYYNNHTGSTSFDNCTICPGGYYCPYSNTGTPIRCGAGYKCPPKSSEPTRCPLFFNSVSGSTSCRLETLRVGCIVVGVVFFGVLLMVIVIYMRKNEQRKKKLARRASFNPLTTGSESEEPEIPDSIPGPIYGGF